MKTTTKSILVACGLMAMLASCSNDIKTPNSGDKEQSKGLQFSFTEEGYGEDEVLSRAAANKAPQSETVDLGDCEAEVSVESEPAEKHPQATTRAITNKHYTIRAYQAGVRKGEIKGTFNGATFTPDAGSPNDIYVEPGSCDFVAFNDDVTPAGENLTVDESKMQTARIATFTTTIAAQKKQQVNFEMKHVCARLRTQFVCQKHMPNNIAATLEETAANMIPASVSYNPVTKAYTAATTMSSMAAKENNSPASTQPIYTASNYGQKYAYTSTCTKYHYFMPTTSGTHLKLVFNAGTVFVKPMVGTIPQIGTTLSMEPNKSYMVKIKLRPKFKYLFSDGTTGFRSETTYGGAPAATAKIPIGLVIKENDGTPSSGIAMALEDADNGNPMQWNLSEGMANKDKYSGQIWNDEYSGYELTWDPTTHPSGSLVKANTVGGLFPYVSAGHYAPSVPVTGANVSKWFLPAGAELVPLLNHTYFAQAINYGYGRNTGGYGWFLKQAVTEVGGTLIQGKALFAATESNAKNFDFYALNNYSIYVSGGHKGEHTAQVRPFVRF